MTRTLSFAIAAIGSALAATSVDAAIYRGVRTFGGSLTGFLTVTTDGTLGTLGAVNVVGFKLTLSGLGDAAENYGDHPVIAVNGFNPLVIEGTSLSATRSALFFDFDAGGGVFGVQAGPYYLLTAADCTACDPSREFLELDSEFGLRLSQAGVQQLGVVPEPGSWALLITGFGLVGAALRRRRTVTVIGGNASSD